MGPLEWDLEVIITTNISRLGPHETKFITEYSFYVAPNKLTRCN